MTSTKKPSAFAELKPVTKLRFNFQLLVRSVASEYAGDAYSIDDLAGVVNEAEIIQKAIMKFDLHKGYRLSTFLDHKRGNKKSGPIRWKIIRYLSQDNDALASVADMRESMEGFTEEAETISTFVADTADNGEGWDEEILSNDDSMASLRKISNAFQPLTGRQRYVVINLHGLGGNQSKTLKEIGEELGISTERVRQIAASVAKKTGLPLERRL